MLGESDGTSRLRWFADLFSGAVFAALFAGFWLPSIYHALGLAAPALFVAAIGWELYSSPGDLREIWRDRELSRAERVGLILLPPLLRLWLLLTSSLLLRSLPLRPSLLPYEFSYLL